MCQRYDKCGEVRKEIASWVKSNCLLASVFLPPPPDPQLPEAAPGHPAAFSLPPPHRQVPFTGARQGALSSLTALNGQYLEADHNVRPLTPKSFWCVNEHANRGLLFIEFCFL